MNSEILWLDNEELGVQRLGNELRLLVEPGDEFVDEPFDIFLSAEDTRKFIKFIDEKFKT